MSSLGLKSRCEREDVGAWRDGAIRARCGLRDVEYKDIELWTSDGALRTRRNGE